MSIPLTYAMYIVVYVLPLTYNTLSTVEQPYSMFKSTAKFSSWWIDLNKILDVHII